ncbi:MAG: molybdopterin-dependent oxidoreductase [Anaerolineae bacterium]|nr:molybdopterin-dependent oxidoreductase [Anaerolineae bacterium]
MSKVQLTIDGKSVEAESGQTILEVAQATSVDIPILCHHPALSEWGACRMCLVQVEGMRGLQTACTCPVTDGMKVSTETEEIANIRKFILELLFSERNHYCMYCQMSGDCELQDLAYRYGLDHWTYPRPFERMEIDASRKYFIMDHNRCILCTRCIRACSEVAANHTLNLRERGADSMIMADLNVPFGESTCIECGTCLQVCPTGALIDARSAYGGREKDVEHTQTTCMQCSVGCQLDVVTRYSRLLRVDGVWDAAPSNGLLCVDGRFKPLYDKRQRVTQPLVRKDNKLVETSWEEALKVVAGKLKDSKPQGLALAGTTNEALAAFVKLFEKAGGEAGRLEPLAPELDYGEPAQLKDILESDYIIVAGAAPLEYQRVVGYFIKRMADKGVPVALIGETVEGLQTQATLVLSYEEAGKAAEAAMSAKHPVIVYSVGLKAAAIEALKSLGDKARILALDPAHNSNGAQNAGLKPMAVNGADTLYFLLGEQSEDEALVAQLNGQFTIVQASYKSPLVERADVVLPTPLWYEREGHITNVEGQTLPLNAVLPMPASVRDDAEVLKVLKELI